jgi:hypothetical protein
VIAAIAKAAKHKEFPYRSRDGLFYHMPHLEQPFCPDFNCACHSQQREIARLLGLINDGILTLHEAADFLNGEER